MQFYSTWKCNQHILTGSIQHNPPHVAVVDCGPLDAPSNGRIDITSTTFQSMAFYSCDPGFNLVGESKRTCLASGNWSSSPPVCNGKSIVTYTVKTGQVIQLMPLLRSLRGNEASVTQQLVSNRILHFHCIAIDCGRLRNPPFGRVDLAGTVINARATYACIPGYVLIGNKFRICLINGRWSGETPVCRLGESLSLIPLSVASYHSKS